MTAYLELADATSAVDTLYREGYTQMFGNELPGQYQLFTETIPNNTKTLDLSWLGDSPIMEEWVGPRIEGFLRAYDHSMTFKTWQKDIAIKRVDMAYAQLPIIANRIKSFLANNSYIYDKRSFAQLASSSGAGPTGYDGVALFHASHPHAESGGTDSNTGTLNFSAANLDATATIMRLWNMENGESYQIMPDTILCGPYLEKRVREAVDAKDRIFASDATGAESAIAVSDTAVIPNYFQGKYNVIVSPRITNYYWYVMALNQPGMPKPLILQENRKPEPIVLDQMDSPRRVQNDLFLYGLEGDFEVSAGAWMTAHAQLGTA